MSIRKISEIFEILKSSPDKKRLVVAYANDSHSIDAVYKAVKEGLIEGILVGDEEVIKNICKKEGFDASDFRIVHETNDQRCAARAVELIRNGEADVIMKGLVSTDKFMRAILNKEKGLVPEKAVLSHVSVFDIPAYHKLLIISDVAVIPLPDLNQKKAIIKYLTNTANALGIDMPKIALIAPSEQVLPKVQSTVEAAILAKMGERGQLTKAVFEGPLALDVAIDKESAEIKKVNSPVAGDADCLLFPNLEAGNVFYKTNTKLGNVTLGAVMVGASVPSVLSSRGDSVQTKLNSIALAALLAK